MKELTIEQKAKAYDKALERAKEMIKAMTNIGSVAKVDDIQHIFPELKESEDERMLRVLREGFNILDKDDEWYSGITNGQIFAWLEKKGETFTKKDVDDAYLKGICDAKHELEKQGEKGTNGNEREIPNSEQKPAERSEEDENIRQWIISDIDKLLALKKKSFIIADKEINWLKSLKERHTWKPSDDQIKVCKEVYADLLSAKGFDLGTVNSELNRLEEQLKKLREG